MKKIQLLLILSILCVCFFPNEALSQRFGKNKKQYKVYDWKYIECTHFDIYYDVGSKPLADFAAIALEDALVSIQTTLNYKLTQRVSVVVYESHNDFQQTNVLNMYLSQGIGGVTELYKNRVIVPFTGSYEQFRHVLHHELVHAVLNDMFYGGTFQTAVTTNGIAEIPLWINEGLAEWESLGGMNAETDMYMRDLTINESLPSLKNIAGYLAYRAGQTFFYFIETKYGKGKITEFMNKLRLLKNLDVTFRNTFGMDIEEFSDMWQTEIKKIYWPDITIFKQPKEFASSLTNHEKDNCYYYSSPAISSNGEKMAFISDRDGGIFAVYVANTTVPKNREYEKSLNMKKLVSSSRQLDFEQLNILTPSIAWSPDSKSVVISAKSGGEDAIYIINADNGKYEKIMVGFASITSVNWSPDGSKIAFVATKYCESDIYYYDLESKNVVPITQDAFTDAYPVWSPDSKNVYFISDRGNELSFNLSSSKTKIWEHNYHQSDIYKIEIGVGIKRITNTPSIIKTCFSISSDESKMLVVANQSGISNIYTINLNADNTSIMRPITNSANGISQISATPDDLNLIFCSQVKGGYDIFMLRNPYEKTLDVDTIPLTGFAKSIILKQTISQNTIDSTETQDSIRPNRYGKFKTDFTHQQFLHPNKDAIESVNVTANDNNIDNLVEKDYEIKFSLDAFIINPAVSTFYGIQGNTAALFSDIMGNHQFYLSAYFLSSLENSQFYGAYLYNTQLIDYQFAFYNNSVYTWQWVDEFEEYNPYSYRATGAVIGASYPFSLFRRIEGNLNFVNASKRNADNPSYESISKFLVVPELQYVLDNSLNGIYAPTRGSRMNIRALYSPRIADISSEFTTLVVDARHYFEFYPNFMSLAVRGTAGISLGANPQKFYIGGVENWISATYLTGDFQLDNPEDFAFMNAFVMPLRGWPVFYHKGTKYAAANIEYRFPILMALATGGIPLIIQGIMGNVFYDIGTAWTNTKYLRFSYVNKDTDKRMPADVYMSAGWGIRAIVLGLPFKFDMAWRNEYSGWSSPYYLFSLGLDF